MKLGISIVAGLLVASVCGPASALTFGILTNASTDARAELSTIVTSGGHSPVILGDLGSLGGVDVLWILNDDRDAQPTQMTADAAALLSFVQGGGVLVYHDPNVQAGDHNIDGPDRTLPGGGLIDFVFDADNQADTNNIEIPNTSTVVTDGIGATTLDLGNQSNHGYALADTLPLGAVAIFSRTIASEVVDFGYEEGLGFVYYSTIPLYYFLEGHGPIPPADAFRGAYARNVAAYAASQVDPVPEPATLLLLGGGLLGLGFFRRR